MLDRPSHCAFSLNSTCGTSSVFTENSQDSEKSAWKYGNALILVGPNVDYINAKPVKFSCSYRANYQLETYADRVHICNCTNGVPAIGETCPENDDNLCVSCDDGYTLTSDEDNSEELMSVTGLFCSENQCTCFNGFPSTGVNCSTHGDSDCESCFPGYNLVSGVCVFSMIPVALKFVESTLRWSSSKDHELWTVTSGNTHCQIVVDTDLASQTERAVYSEWAILVKMKRSLGQKCKKSPKMGHFRPFHFGTFWNTLDYQLY